MKITITINISSKIVDSLVSFMEQADNTRIIRRETHEIETSDDTQENIDKWLSEERKIEYAKKFEEEFPEFTFKVEEISIIK
jgi:hypothetical protein